MGENAIMMPCFRYLIRSIKDQDSLLLFAKNYFIIANSAGISEEDSVTGYIAFRSALTNENSSLQLTMYNGETLSAKDFRRKILDDVELFSMGKCVSYAESIDPLILSPSSRKRGVPTLCNMCSIMKGTKKYKSNFKREEYVLIRYACESFENLQLLRKNLGETKPSSLFKSAVNLVDELDTEYPVLVPLNMLFMRMLENVGKEFYVSSETSAVSADVLYERFENKSALFSANVRKYCSDQFLRLRNTSEIPFQNLFLVTYDAFAQNVVSGGTPSAEYVNQILNTMLKENGSAKRKKVQKKHQDKSIPLAPMFKLDDVFSELSELPAEKQVKSVTDNKELGEVTAENGATLVYMSGDDFEDNEPGSDGIDELPFSPEGGILAVKLSEKYASELNEPAEPDLESPLDEPSEPNEPDEPSDIDINENSNDTGIQNAEVHEEDEDMLFKISEDVDNQVNSANISEVEGSGDNVVQTEENDTSLVKSNNEVAIPSSNEIIVPGENSALYLPVISDDILQKNCVVFNEEEHGELLGDTVGKSDVIPIEIFLSDSREYGLIIYDRLHTTYYVTMSMKEPTISFILSHQKIVKVCWQPYFIYSQCRELGIVTRTVHSLFTSNAIFNPPLPYIPRANTLSAYIEVWRKSHKFRLRKTGITLFDEMQCYVPAYYMQMRTLSDSKALQANYLRDEVLGRSFMRRTMFNDNGCLFDIDKQKGQIHYNANTDISCKIPGVILTYILEQDNLTTASVFHLYMRALIKLAEKGYFRKLPIQLLLMDSTHGIMQLFVGRTCYDLIKTNLQVFFNMYAIQHEAERFRLYVDAQVQEPAGSERKLPPYNLLPRSIDDALDLYSTSDAVVPVADSHIIKPMLARKMTDNSGKIASFPPKIEE